MDPLHHDDPCETDAVWKLLDSAPAPKADARFLERTVRAARLLDEPLPWWKRLMSPAGIAGGLAATAAVTLAIIAIPHRSGPVQSWTPGETDSAERFAELQDAVETEALMAAVEHLDDFSDHELVHLIGL
jgi:hypothetical protein